MCHLENTKFNNEPTLKPPVYCRYADDIFLVVDDFYQVTKLKETFEYDSKLTFTVELEVRKQLPFIDTLLARSNGIITTSVFKKATNTDECLNYDSLCPDNYKIAVIKKILHRSFSICSTRKLFHEELIMLVINFPNYIIDKEIMKFLDNKMKPTIPTSNSHNGNNIAKKLREKHG